MLQLKNLKENLAHWDLESDSQLLRGLKKITEQTYKGIKGIVDSLEDLEQSTDTCLIHLKHAVNWINALSHSKFIENTIQPSVEVKNEEINKNTVKVTKTREEILNKHRKAMQIVINDLGIKELQTDHVIQNKNESVDETTIAIGENDVTPQLKGRLPYFIGSKEFRADPFIGLYKPIELPEEHLEQLKEGPPIEDVNEIKVEHKTASVTLLNQQSIIEDSIFTRETMPVSSVRLDALDSYINNNNTFGLCEDEKYEDGGLPQYKFLSDDKVEIELHKEEVKNPFDSRPTVRDTIDFVAKEKNEFDKLYESGTLVTKAEKPVYKQKVNKFFDYDEDEKEEGLKENSQGLINSYAEEEPIQNKLPEVFKLSLFSDPYDKPDLTKVFHNIEPEKANNNPKKELSMKTINKDAVGSKIPLVNDEVKHNLKNNSFEFLSDSLPIKVQTKVPLFTEPSTQSSSTGTQERKNHTITETQEDLPNQKSFETTTTKLFTDFNEPNIKDNIKEENSLSKPKLIGESLFGQAIKVDTLFNQSRKGKDSLLGNISGNIFDKKESLLNKPSTLSTLPLASLFDDDKKYDESLFEGSTNNADKKRVISEKLAKFLDDDSS